MVAVVGRARVASAVAGVIGVLPGAVDTAVSAAVVAVAGTVVAVAGAVVAAVADVAAEIPAVVAAVVVVVAVAGIPVVAAVMAVAAGTPAVVAVVAGIPAVVAVVALVVAVVALVVAAVGVAVRAVVAVAVVCSWVGSLLARGCCPGRCDSSDSWLVTRSLSARPSYRPKRSNWALEGPLLPTTDGNIIPVCGASELWDSQYSSGSDTIDALEPLGFTLPRDDGAVAIELEPRPRYSDSTSQGRVVAQTAVIASRTAGTSGRINSANR